LPMRCHCLHMMRHLFSTFRGIYRNCKQVHISSTYKIPMIQKIVVEKAETSGAANPIPCM
jgi:hypothetical protein